MTGHDCPHLRSDGHCNCSCSRCYAPAAPALDVTAGECVCAHAGTVLLCKIHRKVTA